MSLTSYQAAPPRDRPKKLLAGLARARTYSTAWPDFFRLVERLSGDEDPRADANCVVERHDVCRAHANTTETRNRSDITLLRRAVDIDVAAKGVPILRLDAFEPEDARDDRITSGRIDGQDLPRRATRFEDGACGSAGPDLFTNFQETQWSGVTVERVSDAKLGSGN